MANSYTINGIKVQQNLTNVQVANRNLNTPNHEPAYITIHNTGREGDPSATGAITYAGMYVAWQKNGGIDDAKHEVQVHYYIDDKECWQSIPDTRVAWHAGDGTGTGNTQSIGIEIIMNSSTNPEDLAAEERGARLAAGLLAKYKLNITKLKTHKDWNGKQCPEFILPHWESFKEKVKNYLNNIDPTLGNPIPSIADVLPENLEHKNYLVFPMLFVNLSQTWWNRSDTVKYTSHGYHNGTGAGWPQDYPIDICGYATKNHTRPSFFYCPCDQMVVKYRSIATNTIWLESTTPVLFANGETGYAIIQVTHAPDSDFGPNKCYVGRVYNRYEEIVHEGSKGPGVTGIHLHVSVGLGTFYGSTGWAQNKYGKWCLVAKNGRALKPDEAFWVKTGTVEGSNDNYVTKIIDPMGIQFKTISGDFSNTLPAYTYDVKEWTQIAEEEYKEFVNEEEKKVLRIYEFPDSELKFYAHYTYTDNINNLTYVTGYYDTKDYSISKKSATKNIKIYLNGRWEAVKEVYCYIGGAWRPTIPYIYTKNQWYKFK